MRWFFCPSIKARFTWYTPQFTCKRLLLRETVCADALWKPRSCLSCSSTLCGDNRYPPQTADLKSSRTPYSMVDPNVLCSCALTGPRKDVTTRSAKARNLRDQMAHPSHFSSAKTRGLGRDLGRCISWSLLWICVDFMGRYGVGPNLARLLGLDFRRREK